MNKYCASTANYVILMVCFKSDITVINFKVEFDKSQEFSFYSYCIILHVYNNKTT